MSSSAKDGLPPRGGARAARLASLPVGHAGRRLSGWGRRLAGQDRDQVEALITERSAEQLFEVLGSLKGGAMKLGQVLSVFEPAMPLELAEPYRRALVKMQSAAPPLPTPVMHRVLDEQLGRQWRRRFVEFDDTPVAAASIGQVYRATYHDGRTVAVKVQYPGADDSLRGDLRQLRRFGKLLQPLLPGGEIGPVLDEVCERMVEELDYHAEADNQRRFAAAFADSPEFVISRVVASAPKVLVQEWVDGAPLARVISEGTPAQRNEVGRLIALFFYSGLAHTGMIHADPHPGNYLMGADGRLRVLDFGAVTVPPEGAMELSGRIMRASVERDQEALIDLIKQAGYLPEDSIADPDEIFAFAAPFIDPVGASTFKFTRAWLRERVGPLLDFGSADYETSQAVTTPPGWFMLHRAYGGIYGLLSQLDAEVPFRDIVERWHPGVVPIES